MMDELYNSLFSDDLITYRLSDGSYIIAEEVEIDEKSGAIFVVNPLELIRSQSVVLRPWVIVEDDDFVELNSSNIVARSNTSPLIASYYLKYVSYQKLLNNIHNIEKDSMHQDSNDEVDNLDSFEDYFSKLNKQSNSRWEWKDN